MKIHATAIFFHICCTTSTTTPITSITTTTTTTKSTTTSSCFQWGIEYLDYNHYVPWIKSPEECQEHCNYYYYDCDYWTWFLDEDPNCRDSLDPSCHLIKNYPDRIVSNKCAVSGPRNCSDPQPTTTSTTTTISTTTHSRSTRSTSSPWTPSHNDESSTSIIIWMLVGPAISLSCGILIAIFKRKWKKLRAQEQSNIMTHSEQKIEIFALVSFKGLEITIFGMFSDKGAQ